MTIINEFGLSPIQEGMLFHNLSENVPGVDIEQVVIGYDEALNVALLERAWQLVVERHPALRTSFEWKQHSDPVQQVHDQVELRLEVRAGPDDEAGFQEFLARDRARGFDLAQTPLMRLTLFDYGQHRYRLVWTVHHILLDGRAFILVLNDVEEFYKRLRGGEQVMAEPGPDFHPYIEWLKSLDLEGADQFWADRLRGLAGPTPLLEDAQASSGAFSGYGEGELRLSKEVTLALREVAKRYDITLNTIVMGVWGLLLSRYSGVQDVLFGATKTSRRGSIADADAVVGLFLNTVPVRATLPPEISIAAALQDLRSEWISLRVYEHTPLTRIKEASGFAPSASLFGSLVVFENQNFHTALTTISECWIAREWHLLEQTNFPLTFAVYGDPEMLLKLEFDRRKFTRETAQCMLRHARQLFESIAANPEQKIAGLTLLTPAEVQQLLVEWNATAREYPRETSLAALVEAQVERTPDAVAVVYGDQQLTYRELNERANELSHELRKHGAGPNQLVGLYVERSINMVMALLAIVKAGAAYLPLDPLFPAERINYMLQDSGVRVLVTEQSLRGALPVFAGTAIQLEDTGWRTNDCDNLAEAVGPEDLAYLIYTSGSTGKPKGVQVLRGALTNFLWSMREWLQLSERDRLLAVTTISFDIAGLEVWLPLLVGAQVVVASREEAADGYALRGLLDRHNITFLQATPVTWRLLFDSGWSGKPDLQTVCGGEAMPPEVAAQLVPVVGRVWNLYGPTETTIWSTGYRVTDGQEPILIGRPLANTTCYILDGQGRPVPVGVIGELYIGGDGLARGYLNRPELTAEKFVVDPFRGNGARMYRTGDLARYRADGNIECLGRIDHQVKIRGYRIELGEIEAALKEQPEIKQAVVIAREDTPGDKRLVAYLVASASAMPATSELRTRLKRQLPDYMVPTVYVFLDQLPISPNGKVDRKALPVPTETQAVPVNTYIAPRNPTEEKLAAIWAGALGVPRVGIRDDFFEMGGDSIQAVRLIVKILAAFPECQPSLAVLMKAPTVEQFAPTLHGGRADWSCLVALREGNERPAFFCVHGAGGNVLSMRDLAMALPPDQPFYCLQARGLDGQSAPFSSVEETAECYVDLVRRVQPHGPYFLGGGCYGGLVAFEMARRLRSLGETVSVVALIDTYNFTYGRFISKPKLLYFNSRFFLRRILHHMMRLGQVNPRDWGSYLLGRARTLLHLTRSVLRIAEGGDGTQFPTNLLNADQETLDGSGELGGVLSRVRDASLLAARNYVPKPYDGHLLVFSAKKRDDDPYRDAALGWRPVALGGVTAYEIEGDHLSIFRSPDVGAIAEELDRSLRQAQRATQQVIKSQVAIPVPQER
jgi:amino acid adenylation domain-containing protein